MNILNCQHKITQEVTSANFAFVTGRRVTTPAHIADAALTEEMPECDPRYVRIVDSGFNVLRYDFRLILQRPLDRGFIVLPFVYSSRPRFRNHKGFAKCGRILPRFKIICKRIPIIVWISRIIPTRIGVVRNDGCCMVTQISWR